MAFSNGNRNGHGAPIARLGIVGLGRAGGIHFAAAQGLPAAHVAAVCDADPAARERAVAAGVRAYATLDALLDGAALDGVVVCTPPADHADTTRRCLARGLHVLCEKPLALTTWDVLTMLQAANRAQRKVMVASKFRHVPEVAGARALLAAGEIGAPVAFEISFCSPVAMETRWNADPAHSGGGVIIDNGCHALDVVSYLFGSIERIQAARWRPVQALPVEDSATLQVWAGDGVLGRVDVSWSLDTARESYLVVQGERGTIEVGWRGARLRRHGGDWRALGGPYDKLGAHRAMLERFVAAMCGDQAPWISAAECLQVVAAVDAAYRSLGSGQAEWVAIRGARELDLVSLSAPADAPLAQSM
jgi:predicted dehydrogenase